MTRRFNKAFTLVELMITLMVTAIMLTISAPSLHHILAHYHQTSVMHTLRQNVWLARNQAITYGVVVTMCHLKDNHCVAKNWQQGATVFIDLNNNYQLDNGEKVIFRMQKMSDKDNIFYNRRAIRFLPTGLASGMNGTLSYCPHDHNTETNALVVNQAGRVRLSPQTHCPS